MSDPSTVACSRCGTEAAEPLPSPPFRDDLGRRVHEEICAECWEAWKERQMLLINHFGLDLRDPEARKFLIRNLKAFLFDEGEGADIDVSREGSVDW